MNYDMEKTHGSCKNYLAVDVFKGICRLHKNVKMADAAGCGNFNCRNNAANDEKRDVG